MKKISLIAILVFIVTLLFPSNVFAQNKAKTTIKLPVFMSGEIQTVDKPIDGDLMIAGGQIKINSNIGGNVYVGGGQIEIGGVINGNLLVAGGTITISGKVLKNVIVGGGQIIIDNKADIGGYVLAGGRKVDLLGNFAGPVKIGARDLMVGEKAVINGNLEADVVSADVAQTSKIVGEKKIQIHEIKQSEKQTNLLYKFALGRAIFSFLSKLVLVLILVKLFGQKIINIDTKKSFWSNLGWGLIVLVVTPFLMLMLLITVIGIPLSGIILSLYLLFLTLSGIVTSIIVGNYVSQKGYIKTKNLYFQGFIGLLLLTLLGLIPFVGGLVKIIILLFGLGIIFNGLKKYFLIK
jgi:hypothetical protein